MRLIRQKFGSLLLLCALAVPITTVSCAEHRVRVYDPYYSDYHNWDPDENAAYRQWLVERHWEYREYSRLDPDRQREYWTWRHAHHDRDRDRDHDRDDRDRDRH